jgi:hypothetical protein
MLFGGKTQGGDARQKLTPEEGRKIARWFESEIADNENTIYGFALFFECLAVFHAHQVDILETCRKQFRNIIQSGKTDVTRAEAALAEARKDASRAGRLREFTFMHCQSHPQADELLKRARILAKTYDDLFPGRSRSRPFQEEEVVQLIENAAQKV